MPSERAERKPCVLSGRSTFVTPPLWCETATTSGITTVQFGIVTQVASPIFVAMSLSSLVGSIVNMCNVIQAKAEDKPTMTPISSILISLSSGT